MSFRMALGQFNATVGDIGGNLERIREICGLAAGKGAGLVVFPEMAVCGYPAEDLLHKRHFLNDCRAGVEKLAGQCSDLIVFVGFPELDGDKCYNSMAILKSGKIEGIYRKNVLPNYGVFDEKRYFEEGAGSLIFELEEFSVAATICEDIWDLGRLEKSLSSLAVNNFILNISASPFHRNKIVERQRVLSECAKKFNRPVVYCNMVGGQDELVFDGRSMIFDGAGEMVCQAKAFEEDLMIVDLVQEDDAIRISAIDDHHRPGKIEQLDEIAEVYEALVLGMRDYVFKNGFKKVLIGLSGGIDSSLAAALAVEALGRENVVGITMPSKFNAEETKSDARKLAENLGIEFHSIAISGMLDAFDSGLSEMSGWSDEGLAYENLQARIRGTILMSLSNQFGAMVVTAGNKSETAVGYSTLYGDTAGGFALIKDVPKTMVYELSRYYNFRHGSEVIPESVIDRVPSAELREGQKDSDSLPDYDLLDRVLVMYVEQDMSAGEIISQGVPAELVERVIKMVDRNEYKRRQSPPGVKITPKAFGRDRRMPITNRYSGKLEV